MTKGNIFKKFAAGVLTFAMLIGAVPAIAEESADTGAAATEVSLLKDHELELLMKLNIVTEAMSQLRPEEMSRGVFSEMLTAMLGVGGGGNAIEELYNLGIVNGYGSGSLKENQTITYYEAIKMVVCALGYATVAEANGGYPLGYVKVAYDCDLISGSIENTNLTYEQGMKLMLDTGNCNTATVSNDYYLSGIELGGETMFYTYFDVMRIEGLLSANGYTSLDGKESMLGEVIIGGNMLENDNARVTELLGYYVEAYCFDDKYTDKVIVAAPLEKYNKELTVLAGSYLDVKGNHKSFDVYFERENGKIDDVNVSDYRVIYNGKLYGSLDPVDLKAEDRDIASADVTFIDNDRDNVYEIVKIDEYETYIVESVNPETFAVYAKYDKSLNLDPEKFDVYIFKASGDAGEFKDIGIGKAISVLKSKDGELVKVYILNKTVTGSVDGMANSNGHRVLTIGSNQYIVSYEYEKLSHEKKVDPVMSAGIKAYLDSRGNIVEVELTSGVWKYGYVFKLFYDENEEKFTHLSIYAGTLKKLELGERVTVDGVSRKVTDFGEPDIGIFDLTGAEPKAIKQAVRFREKDGKLTQLDTWTTYNEGIEDADALGATKDTDMCYANGKVSNNELLYSSTAGAFLPKSSGTAFADGDVALFITSDTYTIQVPHSADPDDIFYYSAGGGPGMYGNKDSYLMEVYNIDEGKVPKLIIKYRDNAKVVYGDTYPLMFLTNVSSVVNSNGEVTKYVEAINLSTGAKYAMNCTTSDRQPNTRTFFDTWQYGDLFRCRNENIAGEGNVLYSVASALDINSEWGMMNADNTVYTSMRGVTSSSGTDIDAGTYLASKNEYIGVIGWANRSHMRLDAIGENKLDPENPVKESYTFPIPDAGIYVVDCEAKTMEELDSSRVATFTTDKADDYRVYLVQNSGKVTMMLIYTNISARNK